MHVHSLVILTLSVLLGGSGCSLTLPASSSDAARVRTGRVERRGPLVFGRIRLIENGKEIHWGILFDRPTPELYHVEADRYIDRIALMKGAFREAFERDGSFGWNLPYGTYLISRIVPWQRGGTTSATNPGKNIFPGIAFQTATAADAIYLGTLKISITVDQDYWGSKWIAGAPAIQVLDEFERDRRILKEHFPSFSGRVEKQLMIWSRDLEMAPPYQQSTLVPILRSLPWPPAVP